MFKSSFPYFLSIGMDFAQYWYGDSWLTQAYYEANKYKTQRGSEEMWLQGYYNFQAFSTALSNLNFGKKHRKANEYLKEPLRVIPLTEEEQKTKEETERKKVIEYFNRLAKKWEENKG